MKQEFAVTVAFPYPSGAGLHIGHYYNYAIVDSYCRYKKYLGHKVFQPFGYDVFGLPTENYARQLNLPVADVARKNITMFQGQMQRMHTGFEEILQTQSNKYVKETQLIFKMLLKEGLAYKKEADVPYCPSCETTLANADIDDNDCCDRCGSVTETKKLNQWYFKITNYKQRLLDGLDKLDWPEQTKQAQRNWLSNPDFHDWCVSRQRKWGCPIPVEGETDTLDTFVDSSFYTHMYFYFTGRQIKPIDLYVCGTEHATKHLIYARFITMFLHDINFINFEEPFIKVVHQGMILNNGEKMSKSKGNAVNPDDYDPGVLRFYLMFIAHYFDGGNWSDQNINGITRFINKFKAWMELPDADENDDLHIGNFKQTIFNYTEAFKFNKVVSEFMTLRNKCGHMHLTRDQKKQLIELLKIYIPTYE